MQRIAEKIVGPCLNSWDTEMWSDSCLALRHL